MQINKIIILGGGSAGWMTAAALASKMSHIDTTLIESSDIPTIGVGESTLGEINAFLRLLGISSYSILNLPGRETKIFPDNMSPLLLI